MSLEKIQTQVLRNMWGERGWLGIVCELVRGTLVELGILQMMELRDFGEVVLCLPSNTNVPS